MNRTHVLVAIFVRGWIRASVILSSLAYTLKTGVSGDPAGRATQPSLSPAQSSVDPDCSYGPRTVAAWSVLLASTLVLASLMQAVASRTLGAPLAPEPAPARLSPATAALADGDDVRARFLAGRPELAVDQRSESDDACATTVPMLYVGLNSWLHDARYHVAACQDAAP